LPKDSKPKQRASEPDQHGARAIETGAQTFVDLFRKAAKKPTVATTSVLT